ncbi:NAD(P)H-hydrate dehydratase [Lacticaseibacillus parakribbianus]|uniref:NAD(P)H-hydrate dehydratase n=1 Tax=Lacticaseibacillus parakribbianus TaxID=2970927 RepID=UPI0021CAE71E|nr:NAD(P)H-hydrate dehydratase [Lacticaseibacillus parakribbianus]
MEALTSTCVTQVIQPRLTDSHKGQFGRVLIIGGNEHFGGAAIMAASAAVYAGAGLTTVATNPCNHTALHARLPEAMVLPYDGARLRHTVPEADVVVIGPGLGTNESALQILQVSLANLTPTQVLILDGSALTLIATHHLRIDHDRTVWTPHQMEWQRLSGLAIADQTPGANAQAAAKLPGIVVVKSHRTQIHAPTKSFVSTIGTPAQATGGSGDVLSGILAAFIGQFGFTAATINAAVFTHSAVAERLAASQYVALPTRVIEALPAYMAQAASGLL